MTLKPLKMPQIALGSDEVIVREWRVAPGEDFAVGQPLLEIETDKASMDVEAPFDGMLVEQRCADGDTVTVGAVIGHAAEVGASMEAAQAELAAAADAAPAPAPAASPPPPAPAGEPAHMPAGAGLRGERVEFVTVPHGELAGISLASPAAPPREIVSPLDDRDAAGPGTERLLSRRRLAIGRRMAAATAIPTFSVAIDVDAAPGRRAVAAARDAGRHVTFTDVLLYACGAAGKAHPGANAWLLDGTLIELEAVNVALAVDAPGGVAAPVVRAVDQLTLVEIALARGEVVTRARANRLASRDLVGATLTLSNVAGLGVHTITPVLTAPQVVAIGVGTARPGEGGSTVTVTVVADHRVLDGADAARLLWTFGEAIASPPES